MRKSPDKIQQIVRTARAALFCQFGVCLSANALAQATQPSASTNSSPRFAVAAYQVEGNTALSEANLAKVLKPHIGESLTINDVVQAASDLQMEYKVRGYPTINVTLPPQQITNGTVRIRVFEGLIAEVLVKKNRYFSSNNIMRTLPSLRTNTLLAGHIFQAEVDRANANQDRQIYPQLEPGPEPNTSTLVLEVKDRLPVHARLELNNLSTPGSPEKRVNFNASYDNLWQLEHSLGFQYGFSPVTYKEASTPFSITPFDYPAVANYSTFYRAPLTAPGSVSQELAEGPPAFGYNEATRRFEPPPATGRPEITMFASRSTTEILSRGPLTLVTNTPLMKIENQNQNLSQTRDHSVGLRVNIPVAPNSATAIRSTFSAGLDFKDHIGGTFPANVIFQSTTITNNGFPVTKVVALPVPGDREVLKYQYIPMTAGWQGYRADKTGVSTASATLVAGTASLFDNGSDFQRSSAPNAADEFVLGRFRLTRDQQLYKGWKLAARGEAQIANEPLVSLEQFGIGGVGSVRGYHEGELYGDDGFWGQLELRCPTVTLKETLDARPFPLTLNFLGFTDFGRVYLKEPQARPGNPALWSAGFALAATFGKHVDFSFTTGWPLKPSPTMKEGDPLYVFTLGAHF